MNKQELIKELENCKTMGSHIGEVGVNSGLNTAIDLAKQLNEPKKDVVPKFVADFIEDGNHYDKIAFLVHQKYLGINSLMRECPVKDWLMSVDYEIVLSLVNGYEVETEPLYYVKFDILYLQKYLVKNVETNQFYLSNNEKVVGNYEQVRFTEQEIKAIDERYWLFKEEVKEDE
ncbi:DUF1642 domain-containing protein [Enterococcus sp. DIV1420a]|uniref:DUF1642 domain-containing protein n=1 Tax=Enterococcus sp. DIV1420a TaxID=2774672 RepID=UPI003F6847A9